MLAEILGVLVRVLAPVLSFTCEEVWEFMPDALRDQESVHLADWPTLDVPDEAAATLREAYVAVLDVREAVTKALEDARGEKRIGKSQEAVVTVAAPSGVIDLLKARPARLLAEYFIVSEVVLTAADELAITVEPASSGKCPRCWNHRPLGTDSAYPEVCERCASVLASVGWEA